MKLERVTGVQMLITLPPVTLVEPPHLAPRILRPVNVAGASVEVHV